MTTPETTRAELDREIQDNLVAMSRLSRLPSPTAYDERSFDEMSEHVERLVERRNRQGVEDSPRAVDIREMVRSGAARTEHGARFGPDRRDEGNRGRADDDRDAFCRSGESIAEWGTRTKRAPGLADDHLSLAKIVKGMATGDWHGADDEARIMSENPSTAGGVLLPAPVSAAVIDRARYTAVLGSLGATIVPMTNSTQRVPRLVTGLTPAWRQEHGPISDQNVTLNALTLTAKSMAAMVKISWELMDDTDLAEEIVRREFANMFAVQFDNAGLYGSGADPEPLGIAGTTGRTIVEFGPGANGGPVTNWDWLVDAVATLKLANWAPSGLVMSPRTEASLAKLREAAGSNVYLAPPPSLANFPRAVSTQIPNNRTQGTAAGIASDIFVAAWSTVYLGVRIPLRIRVLEERFADNGEIALLADLRGDIGIAQPSAVVHIRGVL